MIKLVSLVFWATAVSVVSSTTIADIQGPAWLSPLNGQTVDHLTALVTAKGSNGFYLAEQAVKDKRVSAGLYVYSTSASVLGLVNVGDSISLSGRVSEYRSSSNPTYLYITELTSPSNIVVLSSNNTVTPIVLGKDRSPPTELFSSLDVGNDGIFSVPNNSSRISTTNATLQPDKFGLDFWESLEGQLVRIPRPVALNFENQYGDFWVYGAWKVTGKNKRGGLTINTARGTVDANPEVIIVGEPLDGTKRPITAPGIQLTDIVGVVQYQFGFFAVRPLTAPTVVSRPSSEVPPSTLNSRNDACALTVGDYNVENMTPSSAHIPAIADHIANYLKTPDIMFIQEIQDNSGAVNNGIVSANLTLTALTNAIYNASGVRYDFTEIPPVDGQDGGQPGGNIRVAYLYRPEKLSLVNGTPVGSSTEAVGVTVSKRGGKPALTLNPGRLDPSNAAWASSRKPLVAQWQTTRGKELFTVNVHLSSKGGSSSTQGDARPPINSPIQQRTNQVGVISSFLRSILDADRNANIVISGDFNEFVQTTSVYASFKDLVHDIDDVARIPLPERYTYVFDQNHQQLDHGFVSNAIARRGVQADHVHVNNWSPSYNDRISDHDPTVAKIRLC